jgi:hypothetical protein
MQLAFMDIGVNGNSYLTVPSDLNANYFPYAYSVGARLHSNR